jgi:phytanoyl-CoA hydroxylase
MIRTTFDVAVVSASVTAPGYFERPLGPEVGQFYREQGYVVIEDAFTKAEIDSLNQEALALCRGDRGHIGGVTPAGPGESDDEVLARYLCIHFPHKLSGLMFDQLSHPSIVETAQHCIGQNVKCMQSMLFIKAAGKPGQAWHQDEDYIPTRDRSLCGIWLALDDATVENGCLWVIPGSHRRGILWPQEEHDDRRFDCAREAVRFPYTDEDAVPVEVKAGSLVCFNGYLLHRSLPNRASRGYRRALVNHYMTAESLLPWFGEHPPTDVAISDYRDIVMICGEDPFAYKGTTSVAEAQVRPTGEGGCATSGEPTVKADA